MSSFYNVQELFWELVVVLEPFNASIDVIIVVFLYDGVDLVVGLIGLPKVDEFGVCHEKDVVVKKEFLYFELVFGVGLSNGLHWLFDFLVYVFLQVFEDEHSSDTQQVR